MTTVENRMESLREIVAEVLELEPEEIDDNADFAEEYEADSLRSIEILARIEKKYKIEIPQSYLPEMRSLKAVADVVDRCASESA